MLPTCLADKDTGLMFMTGSEPHALRMNVQVLIGSQNGKVLILLVYFFHARHANFSPYHLLGYQFS